MTDYPVIFSAPMIAALLAKRKTMTRRLAWRWKEPPKSNRASSFQRSGGWVPTPWQKVRPGDRLWCKEAWRTDVDAYDDLSPSAMSGEEAILFDADADWSLNHTVGRLRSARFMPRWASRLTLVVSATRIERLQEISHQDAVAEGMGIFPHSMSAQKRFCEVWNHLHGPGAWEANPEVVALRFAVHHRNIDQMPEAA